MCDQRQVARIDVDPARRKGIFLVADESRSLECPTVLQSIRIAAAPEDVWAALVAPWAGSKWRNADFDTDWQPGSPIKITAMIGEKRYNDRGRVIRVEPYRLLQYSYWSSVSGLPDTESSYSLITFKIAQDGDQALLELEQQVPLSPIRTGKDWVIGPESGLKHAEFYWRSTLPVLKRIVEETAGERLSLDRSTLS